MRHADGQPLSDAARDELVHQAALADARVADDPDCPPVAGERVLECHVQRGALGVAADKRRQAARGRHRVQARLRRAPPDQLQHALASLRALDDELAELAQEELAVDERSGRRADRRGPGRGQRLDPLAERGRVPDRDEVHVDVVADRADDDLARVQPAADRELDPVGPAQRPRPARPPRAGARGPPGTRAARGPRARAAPRRPPSSRRR